MLKQSLHGYKKGKRYEANLEFVKMYGNSNTRHVVMQDENGVKFTWSTNDYTQTFKNLQAKAKYKFTIEYIFDEDINIQRLSLCKNQ